MIDILMAMFNPLPAIALLPLALLWFGLGKGSLLVVPVHSDARASHGSPLGHATIGRRRSRQPFRVSATDIFELSP
ncbi:hypothetical protein [Massilia sp. DD77]|uniref:hypothetical protein n=1 Tax=Massilia sp. DD77 TaxID=3109349 RepID=UPI003FA525BD